MGARIVLRQNLNIEGGWWIEFFQWSQPFSKYPIPRLCRKITIPGPFYSKMRQQFPQHLPYAVTVHRCTVQKGIVCFLNELSICRTKSVEVGWPGSVGFLPISYSFIPQLLEWCDMWMWSDPHHHSVEYPIKVEGQRKRYLCAACWIATHHPYR